MSDKGPSKYRVTYSEATKPLYARDFAVIRSALSEAGGFDGRTINEVLAHFDMHKDWISQTKEMLRGDEIPPSFSADDLQNAFLACCLASAALGEEELSTITGYDRDDFYITIRRLYHAVRTSIRF